MSTSDNYVIKHTTNTTAVCSSNYCTTGYNNANTGYNYANTGHNNADTGYNYANTSYNNADTGYNNADTGHNNADTSYNYADTSHNSIIVVFDIEPMSTSDNYVIKYTTNTTALSYASHSFSNVNCTSHN
jgi:hypothetical protein